MHIISKIYLNYYIIETIRNILRLYIYRMLQGLIYMQYKIKGFIMLVTMHCENCEAVFHSKQKDNEICSINVVCPFCHNSTKIQIALDMNENKDVDSMK